MRAEVDETKRPRRRSRWWRGGLLVVAGLMSSAAVVEVLTSDCIRSTGKLARTQLIVLAAKVQWFVFDTQIAPAALDQLARSDGPIGYSGPYATASGLMDPWRHPILFGVDAARGEFVLVSLGSNGRVGGEGDAADIEERGGLADLRGP